MTDASPSPPAPLPSPQINGSDPADGLTKHRSMTVRVLLVIAGTAFVVLGIVGIFTPLLPTTPFILLAAACYARASSRFYRRLVSHRVFGPMILEWQHHRSIPYRTKRVAITMMVVTLAISIVFFVEPWPLRALLTAFGAGLALWMSRIPSRDAPARPTRPSPNP